MSEEIKYNGDRAAELKLVRLIPEDNYNREVEIQAKPNGLWIDDYIVIPWDWIFQAASALHVREAPQGTYQDRCFPLIRLTRRAHSILKP